MLYSCRNALRRLLFVAQHAGYIGDATASASAVTVSFSDADIANFLGGN
ncbi:MAG: hypothetical protein KGJ80_12915 [Chloroflexota bacterium]|nr:hypothetical protein [Chloroflexota bacterium]